MFVTENDGGNTDATSNLSRKINKILDLRLENDKETLDALKELSKYYKENIPEKRNSLRSEIEKRNLIINQNFLNVLKNVKESLDKVHSDVSEMNSSISDMQSRLSSTKQKTHSLMEHTGRIQAETKGIAMKHNISTAFINKFQLNETELSTLKGGIVSPEMFAALDRVEQIHSSCRLLLQAGCQTIARDIMQQMSQYQEAALERLFRWTQSRCRMIEAPDPGELLPQAMSRLHERPTLFKQLLEEYSANRRDILVRQFIDALTRGGRPIELRATEPKRYVGDMLAWLHQAVPAERDNLVLLLKLCDKSDIDEIIQQNLSNITEGICHPLKVRIEHILVGDDNLLEPLVLHGILNLIKYYHDIISQVVGAGHLDKTLMELAEQAEQIFLKSLQGRVTVFLNKVESPPVDLSPSPASNKTLALLGQLLSSETAAEGKQTQMTQMVSTVVDPLIMYVTETASRLTSTEMCIYLLNCFHFIQTSLALHPFMDERLERLKAQSEAQMDTLTSEQASAYVAYLGLGNIYTILQSKPQKPMSTIPGAEASNISSFVSKLDKFLSSPDMYQLPQLTLLTSNNHRVTIQRRAGSVISLIYKDLYEAVHEPANLYEEPDQLMIRTPEYVNQTLNI